MSIQSEISRLTTAKSDLQSWLTTHNVTVPENTVLDGLVTLLQSIQMQTVYTGTGVPSDTLGSDGDLYLDLG